MPFVKGQSGNPQGRPKGSGRKPEEFHSMEVFNVPADAMPDILAMLTERALNGNIACASLLLQYMAPKNRIVHIDLPPIKSADDIVAAQAKVVELTTSGTLSPDEGAHFTKLIAGLRQCYETCELSERIARIEAIVGASQILGRGRPKLIYPVEVEAS